MSELDEFGYSKDFERCHLGDVAHIEMGQSPDSRFVFEDPYIGYPFLQGNAEFGVVSPSPKFGCVRPAKLVKKSDALVSVRAPVGAVNIADRDYCIGRGLAGIRLSGIEPNLAAQLLQHQSADLRRVAQGTTFEAISKSDLQTLQLRLPPVAELPVIAQLLDTLDTAIHQTEAIVEKLKQVKQGLLHDLLTRGLDANGELRPSHVVAPDLYQESPLGWRPKDWEICRAVSVLTGIDAGKSPECQDVPAKGDQWGVLKVGAVHPDGLKLNENKVIEECRLKNPAYLVRDGDLLLSRANTFELVGLVCYVMNHPERLMLSDKTLRLSVRANRMTTPFLFWQLQHPKTRTQIEIAATGTSGSMKNISQGGVEQLWISRPPIDEQEEIAKRLFAAASRH